MKDSLKEKLAQYGATSRVVEGRKIIEMKTPGDGRVFQYYLSPEGVVMRRIFDGSRKAFSRRLELDAAVR